MTNNSERTLYFGFIIVFILCISTFSKQEYEYNELDERLTKVEEDLNKLKQSQEFNDSLVVSSFQHINENLYKMRINYDR